MEPARDHYPPDVRQALERVGARDRAGFKRTQNPFDARGKTAELLPGQARTRGLVQAGYFAATRTAQISK